MGVSIEQLQKDFPTRNIDPYGQVVIVPCNAFQQHWEKDLESQGHRVFSESYEGQATFFVRLSKGKSKALVPSPVAKGTSVLLSEPHQGKYARIPTALLESSSQIPREIFEGIDELAETIRQYGLLEPLIVTTCKDSNRYEVLVGERRFRACKKAELETVPCIVMDGLSLEEIRELQLIENLQRKDMKPFEEIAIVKQLSERGLNQSEISSATSLSHGTVDAYLKISRALPIEIQRQIVKEGSHSRKELTLTKAIMLAESKADPSEITETIRLIKSVGLKPKALAKKLAQEGSTKLHRVRESRIFWKELVRTLRRFAEYWDEYSKLKEWEEPDSYHLELHVTLPKDLKDKN